jgi:DNA repair protein RecN (Recombination protein N)
LALGARGESGMVRAGCERAEISAEFNVASLSALQVWLQESEMTGDEPQSCLMRRVLYADGRSRAFINGYSATMQQLREAGEMLVDIYSQHAHHSLLKSASQRELLDDFAGHRLLVDEVAASYKHWRHLNDQRLAVEKNAAKYAEELAELRDQVRELTQLNPSQEEWDALQLEHSRLANAASLLQGGAGCHELLSDGEVSVLSQLNAAESLLRDLTDYDVALQEALDGLTQATVLIDDADRFIKRYLQKAELDPQRLSEIESRIQAIHGCARKYRVRPEELADLLQNWQQRMFELALVSDNEALEKAESSARAAYQACAEKLSVSRQQSAAVLSEKVTDEMQRLALSGGKFAIDLVPSKEFTANGLETIDFLVAGHAGSPPRSLAKVASGGELSRISLAIRVITAQQSATPCMIFDEVDVGIGGGVAEVVGQLLKSLGMSRQVLVITHLPQVASQGLRHLKVSKSEVNGQTLSTIAALDRDARVEEIARMLGGLEITSTTRQHALEMLAF